jgi:hypothetical protein
MGPSFERSHRKVAAALTGREAKPGARERREVNRSRARPERAKVKYASLADGCALRRGGEGASKGSGSDFGVVVFRLAVLFEDTLGDQTRILTNGVLDPVGHFRTCLQEGFRVFPALAEPHAVEREPGA